jgi:serine/threonine protein kinase
MPTDDTNAADIGVEGLEDPVEIGVGGFATVYKAFQPAFRRTVAVKVLAAVNLDEAAKFRFERECQAMGSLSEHPNIVTVYGAGFTTMHGSRPYMIMAFLPGGSMAEQLEERGSIRWEEASLIGVHLAGALETAHRGDIIHRDIKPANVLMSSYGDAQLTDFGIARIAGGHETQSGVITASMAHAPPEVLDGERPSVSADVYSLGSTIFELIYGTPAFQVDGDESMVPMLRRILTADPPDLRERGVPEEICTVIEKAMAKDPAARQPSALRLGRELQQARRAVGLDPGKLTIPADLIEDDEDISGGVSFTDSPNATVEGATAAAAKPTPMPTPAGRHTTALSADDLRRGAPVEVDYTGAVVAPAVAGKKRGKGLLVGIIVFVVLLLGAGAAVAVVLSKNSTPTAAPVTSTTTTTEQTDYSPDDQRNFIESCVGGGGVTQDYCKCVYDGIRGQFSFARFQALKQEAQDNPKVFEGPELRKIQTDCRTKANEKPPTSTG